MLNLDIADPNSFLEMEAWEHLRVIIDPELHVNIIDLGLVYSIKANRITNTLSVIMTLSSPHCPVGEAIVNGVKNCLELNFPHWVINVELTWEPVWGFDNISDEGKKQLWG